MAKKCKVFYYETDSGKRPVENFINKLDKDTYRQFIRACLLLEAFGVSLPEPHAKKIDKKEKIYELRFSGDEGKIRILYFFFVGKRVILTNGFIKKTQKVPRKEIKKAMNRKYKYLSKKKNK